MHRILEIALGVALGMTIFLLILWLLGTCVYICCGNTKKIATVRRLKTYTGIKKIEPQTSEDENQNNLESVNV
jgi:hypothetical protein